MTSAEIKKLILLTKRKVTSHNKKLSHALKKLINYFNLARLKCLKYLVKTSTKTKLFKNLKQRYNKTQFKLLD